MREDKNETRCVQINCFEDVLEQSSSYFPDVHVQPMHTNLVFNKRKRWVMKIRTTLLHCDAYSIVESARREFQYIFSAGMYPTS